MCIPVGSIGDLNGLIQLSRTLSREELSLSVLAIPEKLQGNPQYQFLQALVFFQEQANAPQGNWLQARQKLEGLLYLAVGGDLALECPYWFYQAAKRVGAGTLALRPAVQRIEMVADQMLEPRRSRAIGDLYHDWGQHLHDIGETTEALEAYKKAGKTLAFLFGLMKNAPEFQTEPARLLWDMREQWGNLFPQAVDECPVTAAVCDEIKDFAVCGPPHTS